MAAKPKVLVLPAGQLYGELFTSEIEAGLNAVADVARAPETPKWTSEALAAIIGPYDAVMTGWGSPKFSNGVLEAADRLKLIAHSAGSIKAMLPPAVFDRGIAVTHAAGAIAHAVAEFTLTLALTCLKRVAYADHALKSGKAHREVKTGLAHELAGMRIGILGAGYVGRLTIGVFRKFDCEIWVYDPYLSEEKARSMGVQRKSVDEIMAGCPVVSMHTPVTDETRHMIGARELALLRDGAVFINTARAWCVDEPALIAELKTGRIQAALDVFDKEPLAEDSPLRSLPNVVITPHIAGHTVETRHRQGAAMVDEIGRFFAGKPLHYAVTKDMLPTMA
ncbi:MAG: hydroxyacid dehydrogenase [Candidatus Sumerlaeota bacterium]|nr:hydroxyacid dehydrogenase [Candidatus Sumerlaeota bacterium]